MQTQIEGSDRPWAKGTTAEGRTQARKLFADGNSLLKDGAFWLALERYRTALNFWNHPGIHYNMAIALINVDQPIDVRRELILALAHGPEALDQEKFDHAQSYLKLVEQQLTPLEVTCDVPGAVVSLDGQTLFTAPGRFNEFVRPGKHRVSTDKAGFETSNYDRTLLPGQKVHLAVSVFTEEERTRYKRRWPVWVPIATAATGLATSIAGGLLILHARNEFARYDEQIDAVCKQGGCFPESGTTRIKANAERFQTAGSITLGLGGAIFVGGATLVILNIARPYRFDPTESGPRLAVVPVLTPSLAGLSGTARF